MKFEEALLLCAYNFSYLYFSVGEKSKYFKYLFSFYVNSKMYLVSMKICVWAFEYIKGKIILSVCWILKNLIYTLNCFVWLGQNKNVKMKKTKKQHFLK